MHFRLRHPADFHRSLRADLSIAVVLLFSAIFGLAESGIGKPNVVIILADDLGWGDLSIHGNREISTPHLDALATSGMRLERFHASPTGGPSRAGLLTGRYAYRTGVAGSDGGEEFMHAHEVTFAEILQTAGWATGCFGKWQNGANWPHCPQAQGFDTFVGFCGKVPDRAINARLMRGHEEFQSSGDLTETLTTEALRFIDDQTKSETPFLCYLAYAAPGTAELDPVAVHAELETLDREVGRFLAGLESREIADNTIVWFLSDNGPNVLPNAKEPRFNAYLRGAKGSVHEGGVRVPSFVCWPGNIPPQSEFRRITVNLDVLPTILALCGISLEEANTPPLDGISLAPALRKGGRPDRWPNRIMFNSWTPPGYDTRNASVSVRTDRWMALRDPPWRRGSLSETHSGWELYDLNADPYERTDLADDYPFVLSDMRADFSRWMDHTTDNGIGPIPTEFGHPEWPVVTLTATDAQAPRSSDQLRWPIDVIGDDVSYRVEVTPAGEKNSGDTTYRIVAGDVSLAFELSASADDVIILPGKLELPPGERVLSLKGPSDRITRFRFLPSKSP